MSITGVFSKGRPTGHPSVTSILRYIPRPRVPWQPSRFGRQNLEDGDLARLWSRGRYRQGPGNFNSGYSTEKTHLMEDNSVQIIPKKELEKYMPDIAIPGGKALVTPISLMSARNGHRVTHDMLHSYDPHIGRLQKPATVEHENISVDDPNRVGLNAATLDSRGRIYRWLRRGPFFQEDQYFRRSTALQRNGALPPPTVQEIPVIKKIIRLAQQGRLQNACEAYRQLTCVPPVEVYRALIEACIPTAQLADAVAIFEDGNAQMFYAARDGQVLWHLMRCAVRAKHRVRVMWIWNIMCGRYYEDVLVRAEIDRLMRFRISILALSFLLDFHAGEEARTVYRYMAAEQLLDGDLQIRLGKAMATALQEGKGVLLPNLSGAEGSGESHGFLTSLHWTPTTEAKTAASVAFHAPLSSPVLPAFESLALQQNARRLSAEVADAVYTDYVTKIQDVARREHDGVGEACLTRRRAFFVPEDAPTTASHFVWSRYLAISPPPSSSSEIDGSEERMEEVHRASLEWLQTVFPDVAVLAILRHARFKCEHEVDLLLTEEKRAVYLSRVVQWLYLLSERAAEREEVPLPYLQKSKPSMTNENVRVGPSSSGSPSHLPVLQAFGNTATPAHRGLLPSEEGFSFAYRPGMRLVEETFRYPGPRDSLRARFLALQPIHHEVPVGRRFVQLAEQQEAMERDGALGGQRATFPQANDTLQISASNRLTSPSADASSLAIGSETMVEFESKDRRSSWDGREWHSSIWEYLPHSGEKAAVSSEMEKARHPSNETSEQLESETASSTGSTLSKSGRRGLSASANMEDKF